MAVRQRIGDGLAVLAGAHPEVLAAAPIARTRFVALGGVLLSTGGLAVLSAAFAVHMALGIWWPVALLLGIGWGAVIVNLDRMLLVGMGHDASVKRNVALAVPRIGLALVLGTVIATPLTLQVFHREIDTEIVTLQAENSDAYKVKIDADARFRQLPALEQQVATEQAVVASGGKDDPALTTVHDRVTTAQAAYAAAVTQYQQLGAQAQCELNGTCGTGQAGTGTAYQSAKGAADAQSGVVTAAKSDLDAAMAAASAAEARSATQAQSSLAGDRATVASLTGEQNRLQAAFDATNSNDSGILIRLQALSRLSDENVTLKTAHWMLSLLFMCVELLPVLMKVLLNFGPRSTYDALADLRAEGDVAVEELQQQARREVQAAEQELYVLAEKERVERQRVVIEARRRAAALKAEEARIVELAASEARAAARAAVEARAAEAAMAAETNAFEVPRKLWDTGPIQGLRAAARSVRTVSRRIPEREPAGV
jgi:hypothetical protein